MSDDRGDTRTFSVTQLAHLSGPGIGPRIATGKLLDQQGHSIAIGDIY